MKAYPTTQEMILKQVRESMLTIAVDYWGKLKTLHPNVKNGDPAYRAKGMSVIQVGTTVHYLYCRWWVESPLENVATRDNNGVPLTYYPANVTYRISLTLRHLRDDGGTFDEIVGNGTWDIDSPIEKFTLDVNPLTYIIYEMWRATRNDLAVSLFPSPDVDPEIITETITYDPDSTDKFIPTPITHF